MKNIDKVGYFLGIVFLFAIIFGEIRCIYKMCKCNWDPIVKAEVIYTLGTFTGLGTVIGYFNIIDK